MAKTDPKSWESFVNHRIQNEIFDRFCSYCCCKLCRFTTRTNLRTKTNRWMAKRKRYGRYEEIRSNCFTTPITSTSCCPTTPITNRWMAKWEANLSCQSSQSVDGKTDAALCHTLSQSVDGKTNVSSQDDESDVSVHDELDVSDQEPSTDVSHISVDSTDVLSHTHSIVKQQQIRFYFNQNRPPADLSSKSGILIIWNNFHWSELF